MIDMLLALCAFAVVSAFAAAIGAEFLGWLPVLSRWLVELAVRQLPSRHRERYREEWLYDIDTRSRDRKLTALLWAIGTCVTAYGLGRTLGAPGLGRRVLGTLRRPRTRVMVLGRVGPILVVLTALFDGVSLLYATASTFAAGVVLALGFATLALGVLALWRFRGGTVLYVVAVKVKLVPPSIRIVRHRYEPED